MDGSNGSSFWTICHCCSLQYEYPNFCKDKMVLCAHCRKPFRAIMYPTPSMAHVFLKLDQRIKRESDSKVSSRVFSPVASKVEVKIKPKAEVKVEQSSSRESGHVNQLRRVSGGESKQKDQKRKTRKDKGVKRDKFVLPPNMIPPNKLRSALIEKSKSMIKEFTGRR